MTPQQLAYEAGKSTAFSKIPIQNPHSDSELREWWEKGAKKAREEEMKYDCQTA